MIGSLKIKFDGNIYNTKVYLNNELISKTLSLQEIDVNLSATELPKAILQVQIGDLEVDLEQCEIRLNGIVVDRQTAYQVYQDLKEFFE